MAGCVGTEDSVRLVWFSDFGMLDRRRQANPNVFNSYIGIGVRAGSVIT